MTAQKQANKQLTKLPSYHDSIPLTEIFNICKSAGLEPVQEDGTPWAGILCGENGHATFQLAGSKRVLVLDWYTMQSGRFEINTYIS